MRKSSTDSPRAPGAPQVVTACGAIFFALYFTSLVFIRPAIPAATLRNGIHLSLKLILIIGIDLVWFMAVYDCIGLLDVRLLATVFLGCGLLIIAMLFVAAALSRG
jgi:hypothetical protein